MLNALLPFVLGLRKRWPRTYQLIVNLGKRFFGKRLGVFPRILANEIGAVKSVLRGGQWNMAYGAGLEHERLEADFIEYLGLDGYAIAVNTGGMALQMSMRALGLTPGDEIIHQVDTCSATAMAVMNAGCTPILSEVLESSFMLDRRAAERLVSPKTRGVIATHMWGNAEDIDGIKELTYRRGLHLIEDACLALGAKVKGRMAGTLGDVAVFSFGCLKPIQGGEGGLILTRNEELAKELRSLRHWGDRTKDFGVRDVTQLSWNGRMSEIVAAVVRQQLRGYPRHLAQLRDGASELEIFLRSLDGLSLVAGCCANLQDSSLTQLVIRLDEVAFGWRRAALAEEMTRLGLQARAANFEPINSLTLFRDRNWEKWLPRADIARVSENYESDFRVADRVYREIGIGLGNSNILSKGNLRHLKRSLSALALQRK